MLFINSGSIGGYARNPSALNLNAIIKEFCINGNFFNENEKIKPSLLFLDCTFFYILKINFEIFIELHTFH